MGAGFTVNNPNAVAACGCGSSFRTADDARRAAGLRPLTQRTTAPGGGPVASNDRSKPPGDRRLRPFPALRRVRTTIARRHRYVGAMGRIGAA